MYLGGSLSFVDSLPPRVTVTQLSVCNYRLESNIMYMVYRK